MDHETHIQLLGRATGRSHQLELCTAQVLARVLAVAESRARLLTQGLGQGGTLRVLTTLAARNDCGTLDREGVLAWIKVAKAAAEARNRVIHSPWIADGQAESVTAVLVSGSMMLQPRTEADLRSDIETLADAVARGVALLRGA